MAERMENSQQMEQDDSCHDNKRPRCPNWTEQDKIVLIKNIQSRREVLMSKNKGDSALKDAAWQEILNAVNTETHFPRTLEQVKKQHENLKMRARQVYNDIIQCKSSVKPHILSPAMKLMIDDFKQHSYTPQNMLFEDFSHSNSGFNQLLKKKTTPQPILPKPSPSSTISVPVTSNVPFEDPHSLPDWNTNGGCTDTHMNNTDCSESLNSTMEFKTDPTDYTPSAKRQKTMDTRADPFLVQHHEVERIQAETEKHRAETELIYQRRECEYAIFEMKRKVLEAKLDYYKSHKKETDTELTTDDKS